MEPHENQSVTSAHDPNAVWFDDWGAGSSFDLLTNEHTTSVWRPTHLFNLTQAARTPRTTMSAFEKQMTWDDESTTRMWNPAQFVGQAFFASQRAAGTQYARSQVPTAPMRSEVLVSDVTAQRTPPPPPPQHTRQTRQTGAYQSAGYASAARSAPPPPPAARQTAGHSAHARQTGAYAASAHATGGYPAQARQTGAYAASAHATGGYPAQARQTGGYASARATGARPAVRTTRASRPIVAADLGLATNVTDELFARVHSQQLHWLWTLGLSAALFVAVLIGMLMLPIGTPNLVFRSGAQLTPVLQHVESATDHEPAQPQDVQQDVQAAGEAPAQPAVTAEAPQPSIENPPASPVATHAAAPRRAANAANTHEPRAAKVPAAKSVATPKLSATSASSPEPSTATVAAPEPAEKPSRAEPDNAVAAHEPAHNAAADKREEAASARAATRNQEPGMLRINSRPWAQIFIDGQPRGATPQMGLPLKPGHHTVQLVNTPLRMSKTFPLEVQAGAIVTKVVNLIE